MRIQTFSIVAGSEACNARCPYCVSKMTPSNGVSMKEPEVNWRNFRIAARFAMQHDVSTAMITSKGEPTLFSRQISRYLRELQRFGFPFVELQTNGIALDDKFINKWYELGLTTLAVSIVHYDAEKNRQIYLPHRKSYIDLPKLIDDLHKKKFSVRLACTMLNGFIDSPGELEKLILYARDNGVEQLTIRPVNKPEKARDLRAYDWATAHSLEPGQLKDIEDYLKKNGTLLMDLPHGAQVYDVGGQNVCLTNSLTRDTNPDKIRQLIFFPDGHLRYDWEQKGAVLL